MRRSPSWSVAPEQLESREHAAEQVSAVVFDRAGADGGGFWYELRYSEGGESLSGWLSPGAAGPFRSFVEVIHGGLTYFTADWDRRLFERPDQNAPSRSFQALGERPDVKVADARCAGEDLWLLVVLVRGNLCDGGGTEIVATGWVPAYADDGGVTVWHFARGC